MKLGLVMVSFPYNPERTEIVNRSLISLSKTNTTNVDTILQITYKESPCMSFTRYQDILGGTFNVRLLPDAQLNVGGQSLLSTNSADYLLATDSEVTHVLFMYDDFVYNPEWLQQLVMLMSRHEAKAWSVYRSAYTRHHRIIENDGTDVKMSMHDGGGCIAREEWQDYSKTLVGDFTVPHELGGGCTFDLHHAAARPGDRWATGRDYWQNIARHRGIEHVDCAIDFIGE